MDITTLPASHGLVVPSALLAEVQAGGSQLEQIFQRLVQGELNAQAMHRQRNARRTSDEMDPPYVVATPRELVDRAKEQLAASQTPEARVAQGLVAAGRHLESLNRLHNEAQSANDRDRVGNRAMIRAKLVEAEQIAFDLSQALNDTLEALGQ